MAKVYIFTKYDINTDTILEGKRMGTMEFIKSHRLVVVPESEIDVPESEIDRDGLYVIKRPPFIIHNDVINELEKDTWQSGCDDDMSYDV